MRPKTCNSTSKNARNQLHTSVERRRQPKLDAQRLGLALARRRKVRRANWLLPRSRTRRRRPNAAWSDIGIGLDRWQARDYGQESDHENADRSAAPGATKGSVRSAPEAAAARSGPKRPPESLITRHQNPCSPMR